MGVVLRILRWSWKRWADYQSAVAILDLFDAKNLIFSGIGGAAMMFFASTNFDWSAPAVVLAALVAAASISVIFAMVRVFLMVPQRASISAASPSGQPNKEWMPLSEAALEAYEQTQGTEFALTFIGKNETPKEKLKTYSTIIFMYLPINAQKPPSRLYESLTDKDNLHIKDDCDSAWEILEKEPKFISLQVKKADLSVFIERIKKGESLC